MKYYLSQNAGLAVTIAGKQIEFEICQNVGGSLWGVFATDDKAISDALSNLAGTRGISEIGQSEYEEYLAKKNYSPDFQAISPKKQRVAYQRSESGAEPVDAEVVSESKKEHEIKDLLETAPRTQPSISRASSYKKLADAINLTESQTKELLSKPGAPERATSGWSVKKVLEFKEAQAQ